jgi:predicted CXXCH cytochrome family protein
LFAATLFLGLLLPWAARNAENGNALLRAAHLPSDRAWSSGPLHSAHAALGQKCESCHVRAFEQVTNGACLDCHAANLHQHVPANHVSAVSLATRECTSCHVEHDEPGDLVNKDQRLCLDCHADPKKSMPTVQGMQQIADFGRSHPQFRVSMLDGVGAGSAQPAVQRVLLDTPGLRERSGLKFPHDKHLDAKGIKTPDGKKVMGCGDCHVATRDGHGFEPIKMEGQCASCHKLEFDPATPDRTVPHGKPAEVVQALIDHYSGRYLAGYPDRQAAADSSRTISLPSLEASPAARARMLGNARERALVVAKDVFERRMCADCHVVERVDREEWRVQPVKLTQQWMPAANFDHAAHGTSLTPCSTCHAAEKSREAAEILMPGIKVCRDCHAGGDTGGEHAGKLASTCTTCHGFHGATNPLWQQPAARKALRAGL